MSVEVDPVPRSADRLALGRVEPLSHRERIVLAVMAQHYLRFEPDPQPVPRSIIARQLQRLQPDAVWSEQQVTSVLDGIAQRSNVRGARLDDAGLTIALVAGAVLVPPDLRLLDPPSTEDR